MDQNKRDLMVEWNLTYQCNLNCLHCSATEIRKVEDNLTTNDLKEIIEKLSSYKCILHVNPNAGEPTTRNDFVEIYNLMADKLDKTKMTTNGILLSKIIDKLDLRNLSTIVVSMDGPEEIHDKIRGSNTHKRTYKSLRALSQRRKEENLDFDIQINFVLQKLNSESLGDMVAILDENDVNVINTIHAELRTGNAEAHADMIYLSYEECIRSMGSFLHKIQAMNRKRAEQRKKSIYLKAGSFTMKWVYILAKNYGLKDLIIQNRSNCNVLTKKYIHIDPKGNAFPCFFFTKKELQDEMIKRFGMFNTPSILEENIEEILTGHLFENARTLIKEFLNFNNLRCKQCEFLKTCAVCPVYAQLWGVENACF